MSERKSPLESATKFKIGQKKKGLDGNMWVIIETKNGVKRWKKITHLKDSKASTHTKDSKAPEADQSSTPRGCGLRSANCEALGPTLPTMKHTGKTYLIHDNYSRPFLVALPSKQQVEIYKLPTLKKDDYNEYGKNYYTTPIKKYKVTKTFVGKSPLNTMTGFSGGHGSKFDGNSILLKLSKDRYVYIGNAIYEFTFPEEITKYMSPVGNNDVPYPVAFSDNYVLFMFDNLYLPKADFPSGTDWNDITDAYYEASRGSSQMLLKPKKLPKMKQVHKRIW